MREIGARRAVLSLRFRGQSEPARARPAAKPILTNRAQSAVFEVPPDIEFRDPVAAARNLARVWGKLNSAASETLLQVLTLSPDPDSVVVLLDRVLDSSPEESAAAFARNPSVLRYTCLLFGHSPWLGETLIQNTDLLRRIANRQELQRSRSRDEFREELARFCNRAAPGDLSLAMARFRKREYVLILLRDLLDIAKLAETTEEISALGDALLEEAVGAVHAQLTKRHGAPRWLDAGGRLQESRFAIVSLGKLGGNELNYSSDVDLMFLYDGGVEPPSARISNREYFIQLAQKTTELLSRRTREGQVLRIDLRLRPQGHEGDLAVALPRAIQYYSEVAQDWELQAMIKARHSAGDASLTREFVCAIAPFVYRPNVNFSAVKTALQTRERIDKRGRDRRSLGAPERTINVKLDRGGIRDIEFLVQCLQRVYGGTAPWLRSRGTMFALQKLHDKQHISGSDFHKLTKAYEFLRSLEHCLQLRHGQQTHQLPSSGAEMQVLARRVSYGESRARSVEAFIRQVQGQMASVAEIDRRIVYQEQSSQFIDTYGNLRLQSQTPASAENSYSQILQRLAMDAPHLLAKITRASLSPHARHNLDRFLNSAATSAERYGAVLRSPEAVERALEVFECSEYLTEVLVRHPADVELLQDLGEPSDSSSGEMFAAPGQPESDVPDLMVTYLAESAVDRQAAQALFRQQFRRAQFAANVLDLFEQRDIWGVLEENSRAADRALEYALAAAGAPCTFAVMTVGRLGSHEFDVLSDADVLFVADASADPNQTRRAAEQVMEFLTAYTRDGSVFPVDARMRPRGREGELVTTPAQLAGYFSREAKPWEAIAYLRLRFVAGSRDVGEQALQSVRKGIADCARRPGFASGLAEMRRRLESSDSNSNLKTGQGGTYDIDFLAGRMQTEHSVWGDGNLADRVAMLAQRGLIDPEDARELGVSAAFLRRLEHCVRLVTGRTGKWLPASEHAQAMVARLMGRPPDLAQAAELEVQLTALLRRNREICLKYPF